MSDGPTTVHITLFVTVGAFTVAALSLFLGFLLIEHGTTGAMSLEIQSGDTKVNLFTFVPGVGFGFFGSAIAWKALSVLVGNGVRVVLAQPPKASK
ncbi:hypothetical protein [Pseudomonas sp. NFIX28]|uniref:hypothetical protein n=1 Tax=Pseudomonas sp. NFIX28 TaxID=1566235 RepID=UPI000B873654|nr:hypothetical protein [Pseudomonas sp. NFIX28]